MKNLIISVSVFMFFLAFAYGASLGVIIAIPIFLIFLGFIATFDFNRIKMKRNRKRWKQKLKVTEENKYMFIDEEGNPPV